MGPQWFYNSVLHLTGNFSIDGLPTVQKRPESIWMPLVAIVPVMDVLYFN